MSGLPLEISPAEVKRRLDAGEKLRLIDVREPFEFQQARLENSDLMPMRTIPQHVDELRIETAPLVIFCHHGMRSLQVVNWLRQQGVNCASMSGGIDQWSLEIDPAVPRYF